MNLLSQLEIEHGRIGMLLDEIRVSDLKAPETQHLLHYAGKVIAEHLQFEDAVFYPRLDQAIQVDPRLHAMVERYTTEMTLASSQIEKFIALDPDTVDAKTYEEMFDVVYTLLKKRIRSEEMLLFKEYMKTGAIDNPEYEI